MQPFASVSPQPFAPEWKEILPSFLVLLLSPSSSSLFPLSSSSPFLLLFLLILFWERG